MPESRATGGRGGRAGKAGAAPPAGGGGVIGLVGAGPSMVGVTGAMRARDVSRPTDDDVARAERTVVVRRRPVDGRNSGSRGGSAPAVPVPAPPAGTEAAVPAPGDNPPDDYSSAGASDPSDS
jgi:hypothetical protein